MGTSLRDPSSLIDIPVYALDFLVECIDDCVVLSGVSKTFQPAGDYVFSQHHGLNVFDYLLERRELSQVQIVG